MYSLYVKAITGQLRSPAPAAQRKVMIDNQFPIGIWVFRIDSAGRRQFVQVVPPRMNIPIDAQDGEQFVATTMNTGGLLAVFGIQPAQTQVRLSAYDLCRPFDIGPIPTPTREVPIPPDSARVVTGVGTLRDGHVVREQYWARLDESYMLAPLEEKTMSYTSSSGRQESSSEESVVNKSLSVGVSAGWGPVSANVSASLNLTSTTSHQVTITEQRTAFLSDTVKNKHDKPVMYLRWQLTDVVSIFSEAVPQGATIVMGENPILVLGPYMIDDLPPEQSFHDELAALGPEVQAKLVDSLAQGQVGDTAPWSAMRR